VTVYIYLLLFFSQPTNPFLSLLLPSRSSSHATQTNTPWSYSPLQLCSRFFFLASIVLRFDFRSYPPLFFFLIDYSGSACFIVTRFLLCYLRLVFLYLSAAIFAYIGFQCVPAFAAFA